MMKFIDEALAIGRSLKPINTNLGDWNDTKTPAREWSVRDFEIATLTDVKITLEVTCSLQNKKQIKIKFKMQENI